MDPRIGTLFEKHGASVYRRALQLLGDPQAAEEATQEDFIRAAGAIDRFNPQGRYSTWLYSITTNYCLNKLRDAGRRRELWAERGDEAVIPASLERDPIKMVALRDLLTEAEPRSAKAAVAVYVDGMSQAQAAQVLQVSRRTVGNLCDRFVQWARKRLEKS